MKLLVTGVEGQVVRSLKERGASAGFQIVTLGRPVLDLSKPETISPALANVEADAIVNAAAFTSVDKAEDEEALAIRVNGDAPGEIARIAKLRGVPFLHISTDYVFDGASARPYSEADPVAPVGAYGRSKLAGEMAVMSANEAAIIVRTAWVHSPFGANFIKTMLRLGEQRDEVSVVADQTGNPTYALDLADAILAVMRARSDRGDASFGAGVYHVTGSGKGAWADLAEEIFAEAARLGRRPMRVRRISTADYPTAARRPQNSTLDNSKLKDVFGLALPDWRASARECVRRLLGGI